MANSPLFLDSLGNTSNNINFFTTKPSYFIQGVISLNTIDVQVSIRGDQFISDPDYIVFEGESFTIPNPSTFPEGLDLQSGENKIQVRSIDVFGNISAPSTMLINLVQEDALPEIYAPPTSVSVERLNGLVKINVQGSEDSRLVGYNFYCSTSPGGGIEGYSQINLRTVTESEQVVSYNNFAELPVDVSLVTGPNNELISDPLYFKIVGTQEDSLENVFKMDFNELLEVPENFRDMKVTVNVKEKIVTNIFSFTHNRSATTSSLPPTIPNGNFAATPEDTPLYYVIAAVYLDPNTNTIIESPFSEELVALPLRVTTQVGSFPIVTRDQIVRDLTVSIFKNRKDIDVKTGSFLKDTFIDPFSQESTRLRYVLDFIYRADSFSTLLEIDDPNFTGTSVPVEQSSYKLALKQAFGLSNNDDVQQLIDLAFEKRASNYGLIRLTGERSIGEVVFYTTRIPSASINIPIGTIVSGGSINFRTTSSAQITLENIANFYNGLTKRYSVRVSIESETTGSNTIVGANQIRTIVSGPSGLSVINESATFGGKDLESNFDLSARAINRISSVDTGTEQGYRQTVLAIPDVNQITTIAPGNELMLRDILDGEHIGGKVDIWVRGSRLSTITNSFAFSFEMLHDASFEIFGDPINYEFICLHPSITEENPIIEMLDFLEFGRGFRNNSTGIYFNLTDVEITAFNRIKLSKSYVQPSYSIFDSITGDVRFRKSNKYIFPRQPVELINSLVGTLTGTVSSIAYNLIRNSSPLNLGRSVYAEDYLQVVSSEITGINIPSSDFIEVQNETVVIVGEYLEYLRNLGINPLSVVVWDTTRTTKYKGPYDPSGSPDYIIVEEEGQPLAIKRTTTGSILSGQTLSIDYYHDENFVVTYTTDFLIKSVQDKLDQQKHITADIIAKKAVLNTVDVEATIVLSQGANPASVNSEIQNTIINFISSLGLNRNLRISDVVSQINEVPNVSYVILPLTKLVRSEGSHIINEEVLSTNYFKVSSWSNTSANVYLLTESLKNATTTGGGPVNNYRYVAQDDIELELQLVSPSTLGNSANRAYIIGKEGLPIPGYSDDATLQAQGYLTDSEIEKERSRISGNRVLVSLVSNTDPSIYRYNVTYFVGEDSGVKDIITSELESLTIGSLVFTFDEDRGR